MLKSCLSPAAAIPGPDAAARVLADLEIVDLGARRLAPANRLWVVSTWFVAALTGSDRLAASHVTPDVQAYVDLLLTTRPELLQLRRFVDLGRLCDA